MAVTLARKIKRIGIMPSTVSPEGKRTRVFYQVSDTSRAAQIAELRAQFKAKRVTALAARLKPTSSYRRPKNRRKVGK